MDLVEKKVHRVPYPEHPARCQATDAHGQCEFFSVAGMVQEGLATYDVDVSDIDRCPKCAGHIKVAKKKREALHAYRLQVWQQRVDEFSESDTVKSLRGEIGILRLLLEQIMNRCNDTETLMLFSTKISSLVRDITATSIACDKLDQRLGVTLDRATALQMGGKIVEIIAANIDDPTAIDQISEGIINVLAQTAEPEPELEGYLE